MAAFKEFFPDAISTDVIAVGSWLDCLVDARRLPFAASSVGSFVMADVLHHLPRPFEFLRDAERVLRPGGRLVILEPAATPWSRLVLGLFHHESVDLDQDVFAEERMPPLANDGHTFANQAFGSLLFVRDPQETLKRIPGLVLQSIDRSDFVVYPAAGAFSYFCLVPDRFAGPLQRLEGRIARRTGKLTALRLLIVLECGED